MQTKLFGSSGVRGVVRKDLTVDILNRLGMAIASSLPAHSRIIIATDSRTSRRYVKSALVHGLMSCGVDVIDFDTRAAAKNNPAAAGILPTPALAFFARDLNAVGIMITASHNPPQYNGIKLFNPDGIGFDAEQEKKIQALYISGKFRTGVNSTWRMQRVDKQLYFDYLKTMFASTVFPPLKVVVDPGNGAASLFASELFTQMGIEVIPLNDSPDGKFPNRSPEPKEETLGGTFKFLQESGADLAVCFDGDPTAWFSLTKRVLLTSTSQWHLCQCCPSKPPGKRRWSQPSKPAAYWTRL